MTVSLDTAVLEELDAVLSGAQIGAMPFKVLDMRFNLPLTDNGRGHVLKGWAKIFQATPVAG